MHKSGTTSRLARSSYDTVVTGSEVWQCFKNLYFSIIVSNYGSRGNDPLPLKSWKWLVARSLATSLPGRPNQRLIYSRVLGTTTYY
jgi:hypothetical protein